MQYYSSASNMFLYGLNLGFRYRIDIVYDNIYLKVGKSMAGKVLKTKQVVQSYINENDRINYKLQLTVAYLGSEQQPLAHLKLSTYKINEPIKLFRCLILLHRCQFTLKLCPESMITMLSNLCSQSKPNPKIRLDIILHSQVLQQYALYLQKRCQFISQKAQHDADATPQEKLFRVINLIKCGLAFVDILYTFGRYYKQKYGFILDFNMLLAQDFQNLYERRIKITLKANRHLYTNEMKQQIEKIHEGLYLVYYNCYYYKELQKLVPKFIDTQPSCPGRANSMQKRNNKINQSEVFNIRGQNQSCSKMSKSQVFNKSLKITQSKLAASVIFDKNAYDPQQQSNISGKNMNTFELTSSKILSNKGKQNSNSLNNISFMSVNQSYTSIGDGTYQNTNCCKRDELVMQEVNSEDEQEDENYKVLQSLERVVAEIQDRAIQNNSKCSNLTATP